MFSEGASHGLQGDTLLVSGTGCAEVLLGAIDNDVIFGFGGSDYVLARCGDDTLIMVSAMTPYTEIRVMSGGIGADFLIGGNDRDQLRGDAGNDTFSVTAW